MNADRLVKGLDANLTADVENLALQVDENKPKDLIKDLINEIEQAVKDLIYLSETDAKVVLFVGNTADTNTQEVILSQLKIETVINIEEKDFSEFFEPLTAIQDWFGVEEKEIAAKFTILRDLLKENLKDLKVYKVGKINIDIYVIGLDSQNIFNWNSNKISRNIIFRIQKDSK